MNFNDDYSVISVQFNGHINLSNNRSLFLLLIFYHAVYNLPTNLAIAANPINKKSRCGECFWCSSRCEHLIITRARQRVVFLCQSQHPWFRVPIALENPFSSLYPRFMHFPSYYARITAGNREEMGVSIRVEDERVKNMFYKFIHAEEATQRKHHTYDLLPPQSCRDRAETSVRCYA